MNQLISYINVQQWSYACSSSIEELQTVDTNTTNSPWAQTKLCEAKSGFAKQCKKLHQFIQLLKWLVQLIESFYKVNSGFVKLLSMRAKWQGNSDYSLYLFTLTFCYSFIQCPTNH